MRSGHRDAVGVISDWAILRSVPGETESVTRSMLVAFSSEGIDAALKYFDPAIEWMAPPEWLEDRLYEGHEGIKRLALFWTDQFDDYAVDPEDFIDLDGDRLLLLAHQRGRIRSSDVHVEQPIGWIVESRAGKLTKVDVHFSWEAARAAAGLPPHG